VIVAKDPDIAKQIDTAIEGALVIVRLSGDIRLPHLQTVKGQLATHPHIDHARALLVDLRTARFDALTAEDLRGFAAMPVVLSAISRRAFVAPGDLGFALARMFEILRADDSRTVQVFRDFEEGRAWAMHLEPGRQNG
jgi:glyoxylase-like metal-dependent hydrolase (beta-lactamase superfamily II)